MKSTNQELREIIDSLASGERYTTMYDILSEFNRGIEIGEKIYTRPDYHSLKTIINKELKDVVEFKNEKDVSDGFRYKKEYRYFFRKLLEKKAVKSKVGDDRTLFLTGGLQMLLEQDSISEPKIELECISELENLNLVKILAPFLGKTVISFDYHTGYVELQRVTLHPHLLKEYNSRWFLFGYVCEEDQYKVINCSVDRIVYKRKESIMAQPDITFQPAPDNFYSEYFKDIIGVTKPIDGAVQVISIHTTDHKVHQLINTKPLHHSQKEIKAFSEDEGGLFTIRVIPNIELRARLLAYGSAVYVTDGGAFEDEMKGVVAQMAKNYQ